MKTAIAATLFVVGSGTGFIGWLRQGIWPRPSAAPMVLGFGAAAVGFVGLVSIAFS